MDETEAWARKPFGRNAQLHELVTIVHFEYYKPLVPQYWALLKTRRSPHTCLRTVTKQDALAFLPRPDPRIGSLFTSGYT